MRNPANQSSIDAPIRTVHSLLLPLSGFCLILPQPTIVEIMPRAAVTTEAVEAADWFIGVFKWRTEQVPLISFEKMCGEAAEVTRERRYVVVLHALSDLVGLATYYAVELTAIPHPALLTPASLSTGVARGDGNGVIAADVLFGRRRGIIPALEQVEWLICGELASLQATFD